MAHLIYALKADVTNLLIMLVFTGVLAVSGVKAVTSENWRWGGYILLFLSVLVAISLLSSLLDDYRRHQRNTK